MGFFISLFFISKFNRFGGISCAKPQIIMNPIEDVIAAIATPIGEGGLAIIRVSGKGVFNIVDRSFHGKLPLSQSASHTAHFGDFVNPAGEVLDEVVATVFRQPHSYTTQDIVEITCHGGMFVTNEILSVLLRSGARMASPGEFTKRAFLNGRIDLAKAEAVSEMIRSRSANAHRASLMQLKGRLSEKVNEIRSGLMKCCSLIELELDFAEEGIELADKDYLAIELQKLASEIESLLATYESGKICRDGVRATIVGKPNAGKSSILNSLILQDRAIVSDIPGTTRDTLDESVVIEGILFALTDTAGVRSNPERLEAEGISRTLKTIGSSEIIILVVDASSSKNPLDEEFLQTLVNERRRGASIVVALNKVDLIPPSHPIHLPTVLMTEAIVRVSALSGEGIPELRRTLIRVVGLSAEKWLDAGAGITNARHRDCLISSHERVLSAISAIRGGLGSELLAIDLRRAANDLGEITGVITSEDILNNIFGSFCIGK